YHERTLVTHRVFDFSMDEPEPQHAYDLFAPGPLPGYAGNPNNMNGWIEADVSLLGELGKPLGAEVDEPLDDSVIDELAKPIVKEMDEEWLMTPVTPPSMPVMPPPSTYEVGGPSTAAAEGHSLTLLAPRVPVSPSVIEDLCTRMGNVEYGHGLLVKKVITVSDVEAVRRLEQVGTRMEQDQLATTQRDELIFGLSQQVQTLQAAVQHMDAQIQQLQTLVAEMSSRESTLM
ncbi:hypothetical protein Tco_0140103, partial [Tanacetum coccineum]